MQKVEGLQHYLEVQNFKVSLTLGEVLLQKKPLGGGGNGIVYKAEIGDGDTSSSFSLLKSKKQRKTVLSIHLKKQHYSDLAKQYCTITYIRLITH